MSEKEQEKCSCCGLSLDENSRVLELDALKSTMKSTAVMMCMECGKCTSTCPVALVNSDFSPRKIVSRTITGGGLTVLDSQLIWNCLTCGLCNDHCPSDVHFAEFIRNARAFAEVKGAEIPCSHGGLMQSLMRLMTSPDMKQNRLDWVKKSLKISDKGEYMLFVGCLPYYDAYFDEFNLQSTNIANSAISILNKIGITPALSENERCCGHDLYWSGDDEMFRALALQNAELIAKTGASKIITTCAECFTTLKSLYPKVIDFPYEVIHITEFISNQPELKNKLKAKESHRITYHDPCRLSRHSGVIEEPRDAFKVIKNTEFREMQHHGKRSNCCGTSSWMSCSSFSKMLQASRLKEAKDTGADLLITSCPKCMIHFKCAQNDTKESGELAIDIKDFAELISECLE